MSQMPVRRSPSPAGWKLKAIRRYARLPVDQPIVIDERIVTFWQAVGDEEVYGTPVEVAQLLVRLHALTPPASVGLQPLRPFTRAGRRIKQNGWFSPADRSFLCERLTDLRARYSELSFVLPAGVIHGDASVGNVIRDRDGHPVLIDLDGFAIGPREWDLVLTAMYYDSFGWHTSEEYEAFSETYDFDVMSWPGYPVLRDVRQFLMVTWLSQKADGDEQVATEVRKRIASLRSGDSKKDWIEAQFTALRYFALDGTDHASHEEQGSMIRRYIIWRNNHAYDERLRRIVERANVA
jgi:hypothetical protein